MTASTIFHTKSRSLQPEMQSETATRDLANAVRASRIAPPRVGASRFPLLDFFRPGAYRQ